jgi:hypothetical protein
MFSHQGKPRISSPMKNTLRALAGEFHSLALAVFEHHRGTFLLLNAMERWQQLVNEQWAQEQQEAKLKSESDSSMPLPENNAAPAVAKDIVLESKGVSKDENIVLAEDQVSTTLKRYKRKPRGSFSSAILKHCLQLLNVVGGPSETQDLSVDQLMDSWNPLFLQFLKLLSMLSGSTVLPNEIRNVIAVTMKVITAAAFRETTLDTPSAEVAYIQWAQGLKQALHDEELKILKKREKHSKLLHSNNLKALEVHRIQIALQELDAERRAQTNEVERLKEELENWHTELGVMQASLGEATKEMGRLQEELEDTNWRYANYPQ